MTNVMCMFRVRCDRMMRSKYWRYLRASFLDWRRRGTISARLRKRSNSLNQVGIWPSFVNVFPNMVSLPNVDMNAELRLYWINFLTSTSKTCSNLCIYRQTVFSLEWIIVKKENDSNVIRFLNWMSILNFKDCMIFLLLNNLFSLVIESVS